MTDYCAVRIGTPEACCGQAVQVRVYTGCVHEHINEETVCQECAESLRSGVGECLYCRETGHRCMVHLIRSHALV